MKAAKDPVMLDGGNAEVWTWRKRVSGACASWASGTTVSVTANGVAVPANIRGKRFSAVVPLEEGRNLVVATCTDGKGRKVGSAAVELVQRLKRRPTARIRMAVRRGRIVLDGGASEPSETGQGEIARWVWRGSKTNPEMLALGRSRGGDSRTRLALASPKSDGQYEVSLKVVDVEGRADVARGYFVVEGGKPRLPQWETENPAWVESAVVYGVVPHNFGPYGLGSVIERMDYLRGLGITALWLSPCTVTPGRGHGYGVSDYFRVRRDYGTKRDLRRLVQEAHARGIRVLMDFVPNHSSIHHPYMEDVLPRGNASPYYRFYDWKEDGSGHAYYFHWRHLPNLNYDNPEVRRWMLEAFSYWVRECDVDGFRVDVAWGIKLRRPSFWPAWRRELKRIKADLLLLAEASARDPYYFTHGFDAAYDWSGELGKWAMEGVFDAPDQIAARLRAALTNHGQGYHEDALIFRFLTNNDTGPRFITRYGVGMEKVAAAMLLTLPGLPCIYTGQEVGAEFEPYRTLTPISWEDRHGLRSYYQRLIGLRRETPSLHSRRWEMLDAQSGQQVLAYLRCGAPEDQPVLVALNFSAHTAAAQIAMPRRLRGFGRAGTAEDLLAGEQVKVTPAGEGRVRLTIPGSSARLLVDSRPACG